MRLCLAVVALLLVAPLTACDDPNAFRFDPQLVTDTLVLGTPSATEGVPTALDLVPQAGGINGRFPERAGEAEQWDLALRVRDGRLSLVPARAFGIRSINGGLSSAGITRAQSRSFEQLIEAPGRGSFVTDSAVALQEGAVYVARSRLAAGGFSGCEFFAKIQPLEIRPAEQTVRLQIVANTNCSDPRLAEEG